MSALFAIGLLLAAVAPSNRVATALAIPMFFVVMLLGGVYLPRVFLPDILDPDRRLHAAGRPGPPGRVARDRAAAAAAGRHGGRDARRRGGRGPAVPVGVTRPSTRRVRPGRVE